MFSQKCAYCEKTVEDTYHPVEHFRPQSVYPRLAYEWTNLLLACDVCNSGYKRQQFPLIGGCKSAEDTNNPCSRDDTDANALIDPCNEDPADFFAFNDEWITCRNQRAKVTRDICGLNREGLKDRRKLWLPNVELAALAFLSADRCRAPELRRKSAEHLNRLISPSSPFSAMARAKIVSMGIDMKEVLALISG